MSFCVFIVFLDYYKVKKYNLDDERINFDDLTSDFLDSRRRNIAGYMTDERIQNSQNNEP